MIARPYTAAIAAALTAIAIVGASVPAVAKDNQSPSFDTCFSLAVERGSGPNKGGGTKEHSQHKAFMDQCMAGKIVVTPQTSASAVSVPANAYASTAASKRINRLPAAR
jgi:hypothetical protein